MGYRRQYYQEHKRLHRNARYKNIYGITLRIYEKMLKKQNYRCACCNRQDTGSKATQHFDIDEHPVVKTPRGLLCGPCNRLYVGLYERGTLDPWHPMTRKIENYLGKYN